MSYILSITKNNIPILDKDAWKFLDELSASNTKEPAKEFINLLNTITQEYPDITTLSEDKADEGVWSDGPLINNARSNVMTLGILPHYAGEVADFIIKAANKQGLIVFDFQLGQIYRP
ncbi:MAG TPA: hypothetical protein VNB90_01830 [Cytophagaceae bacterium]|jgi:hypothetical protein|nr:hypothetical protein [Cytophagaceae bacterium]